MQAWRSQLLAVPSTLHLLQRRGQAIAHALPTRQLWSPPPLPEPLLQLSLDSHVHQVWLPRHRTMAALQHS